MVAGGPGSAVRAVGGHPAPVTPPAADHSSAARGAAADAVRPRYGTVLFDLDGTLVDSVYQHVTAWQVALAELGIPLSVWRIHRRIGMSGGLFLDALQRETGVPLADDPPVVNDDHRAGAARRHGRPKRATRHRFSPLPRTRTQRRRR